MTPADPRRDEPRNHPLMCRGNGRRVHPAAAGLTRRPTRCAAQQASPAVRQRRGRPARRRNVAALAPPDRLAVCLARSVILVCLTTLLVALLTNDALMGATALYAGSVLLAELFAFERFLGKPAARRPGHGPILACATLLLESWMFLGTLVGEGAS